jgi:hypothetical protein
MSKPQGNVAAARIREIEKKKKNNGLFLRYLQNISGSD